MAFVLYAVLIPISHLTIWYNYTLTHESVHNAEHLAFLLVGYLFWRQIFGNDPNCYRLHPALQFFYLFMAIPIDTFTGLSLAGATKEMFPAYFATHRTWGPSYVDRPPHRRLDIMWVVGDTLMLWPMIPVALRWMHMEERKAVRIDRELDAQALAEAAAPARSAAEVHQLHPDPVGIGAVDELERASRRGRWSSGSTRPRRRRARTIRAAVAATSRTRKDRWVSPSWLTARRSRSTERARAREGQELDRGRAPPDELRGHGHVGEVHEPGEFGADRVRLGLLEAEGVAVEAQRPLQVAHADAEVREDGSGGVVHGRSLPVVSPARMAPPPGSSVVSSL